MKKSAYEIIGKTNKYLDARQRARLKDLGVLERLLVARMVEEQRTEIGTLKALGYTDREIQKKYLIYSLSATVLGSGLGLAVGFKLFPTVIYDAYCIMYDLPPVEAPFHWGVAAICVVVALGCVTLVTCNVCHGVLSEMPANIMRPKAPPAGQRVLLERCRLSGGGFPSAIRSRCAICSGIKSGC